jgi:transposase InsO family protein
MVEYLEHKKGYSERGACRVAEVSRGAVRYEPKKKPGEELLRRRIRQLARRYPRYGNARITQQLRRGVWRVNRKRVHRIRKEEGLVLPRQRPKRRRRGQPAQRLQRAEHRDHVWSYDFVEDRTEKGGRLRILAILDEYTRECLALPVAPSMTAQSVIHALEWLFLVRGVPEFIRSDNGPEFVAQAVQSWLGKQGCQTLYIEPGSPWENGLIESFIGKFRDECLNMEIFRNGAEARVITEAWREEYNRCRPHSALGYLTPQEFAAQARSAASATPQQHLEPSNRELILT